MRKNMQRNGLFNDNTSPQPTSISAENAAVLKRRIDDLNRSLKDLNTELFDSFYRIEDSGPKLGPVFVERQLIEQDNLKFRMEVQQKCVTTLKKMLKNELVTTDEQQD